MYFKVGKNSWRSKKLKDTSHTILEDKIEDILEHIRETVISIQEDRRESERRRIAQEIELQHQRELK